MYKRLVGTWRWWAARRSYFAPAAIMGRTPLDLRIVGRMLLHAALVGAAAGLIGAAFVAGAELVQSLLLERLAGVHPLRTLGDPWHLGEGITTPFRPWVLLFVPAFGALVGGLLCIFAPESRGGGGDAMIEAFHHQGAQVRSRVIWVRALSAIFTLGSGGSGGREGPTMQMGGAIGAAVARLLRMGARERRILYIAGVAAGMAAVFRTPLGAALLAVEVLYRDDFESEALVPAVLASVVSYSVVISISGQSTLFGHLQHFAFVPSQLPLYVLLALLVAGVAALFAGTLHTVHDWTHQMRFPAWARPAMGGLALGAMVAPMMAWLGPVVGQPGQGLGLLGGGYGLVQVAISGADWLPNTWHSVQLLALLGVMKLLGSSLTVGTGGSAGDFAPSVVLGGITGGCFGRVASLLLNDSSIDPGAFALVGMATFYGGIAHAPLSSLVMVCELAGSYDLLVPLMAAEGVAFVALRHRFLYKSQVISQRDSPVHRDLALSDAIDALKVADVMVTDRHYASFTPRTSATEMLRLADGESGQQVFPVLDEDNRPVGIVTSDVLRMLAVDHDVLKQTLATDISQKAAVVKPQDSLRQASHQLVKHRLRSAIVVDNGGKILGFLDEADIANIYFKAAKRLED